MNASRTLLVLSLIAAAGCARQTPDYGDRVSREPFAIEDLETLGRTNPEEVRRSVERELHLTTPLEIVKVTGAWDGGSLGGILRDCEGDSLGFWWDNSMPPPGRDPRREARQAYLGASYFKLPGSRRLLIGSAEERALILALWECVQDAERDTSQSRERAKRQSYGAHVAGPLETQRNTAAANRR